MTQYSITRKHHFLAIFWGQDLLGMFFYNLPVWQVVVRLQYGVDSQWRHSLNSETKMYINIWKLYSLYTCTKIWEMQRKRNISRFKVFRVQHTFCDLFSVMHLKLLVTGILQSSEQKFVALTYESLFKSYCQMLIISS